jgi:sulfite exporter TauE/SafE
MIDFPMILIAFSIGILGGAHCIGMCGGIIGALTMSISVEQYRQRFLMILTYNLGRILSYLLIAWVFYQFVHTIADYFALQFMRYIAGALLIAMGLYLAGWWRGLIYLEKAGAYLWRFLQPLSKKLLPVNTYPQAFFLGMLWGWLPCGLIYTALAYAAVAESSVNAVLIMLAFAIGTLPAVMASGLLAERLVVLVKHTAIRQGFAILIIVFGVWTLSQTIYHSGHHTGDRSSHQEHAAPSAPAVHTHSSHH